MKAFRPSAELPEFALEHVSRGVDEQNLAELFAQLTAPEPDSASLARGRARLLAAVAQSEERFAPLFDRLTTFFDLSADALRLIFKRSAIESDWEPGPLPGVSLFHFQGGPALASYDTGFVRFERGMTFPLHLHRGEERVLVLSGGYFDDQRRFYGPGEMHHMLEGTQHALQMNADRDVLIAVAIAGRIKVVPK